MLLDKTRPKLCLKKKSSLNFDYITTIPGIYELLYRYAGMPDLFPISSIFILVVARRVFLKEVFIFIYRSTSRDFRTNLVKKELQTNP